MVTQLLVAAAGRPRQVETRARLPAKAPGAATTNAMVVEGGVVVGRVWLGMSVVAVADGGGGWWVVGVGVSVTASVVQCVGNDGRFVVGGPLTRGRESSHGGLAIKPISARAGG
eukprot:TRINITY_DN5996_c1_g1_i3.p3 TRINITY_DN5996_c1_g1~~TRINITY_DN5996_c1_g1_i3.p3  ORF type:complete len:114 (-),score=12.30 TRINITY_DN5996_c1_g1_i3:100-441(-)